MSRDRWSPEERFPVPEVTAGSFHAGARQRVTERYELRERVGQGAMGLVYRARDLETGHEVALKTLRLPDPEDAFRLKREFRTLADISHPNLVTLFDLVVSADVCFFTMEWIRGGGLLEWLRPGGQDPPRDRLQAGFWQLALGVRALHRAEKLHRDIKPGNAMVTPEGRAVLLDFGLATGLSTQLSLRSMYGALAGTLQYMSPEQAWGRPLEPAADWYAVGAVLYEALTGRAPFADRTPAELMSADRPRPPAPSEIAPGAPAEFSQLAMALLAPDPHGRPSEDEIFAALEAASAEAKPAPSRSPEPSRVFVGRHAELAVLREAAARSRRGEPIVVTVEGESGIGKTSLIEAFAGEAEGNRTLVLRSRCQLREDVPFKALDALVDDLSRFLVAEPPESLAAFMPRGVGALLKLFPVLGRVPFRLSEIDHHLNAEPFEVRRQAFVALRELLARVAGRGPLVLSIDDFQWTDGDSIALLRELLRSPGAPPATWLLAVRTGDGALGDQDAEAWQTALDVMDPSRRVRLPIGPLPLDDAHALAEALIGDPSLPTEQAAALASESGGSPFLIESLARHAPGVAALGGTRVAEMVAARLDRLGPAARDLLELVALSPGPVARSVVLEAVAHPSDPNTAVELERSLLLRTTVVDGRDALEPYHARIREGIEATLPEDLQRAGHLRLARALERRADADPMALHAHYLGAGLVAEAADAACRAAQRAAKQLAFERAAALFARALELGPDAADTRDLRRRRAEALAHAGRGREAAEEFGRAAAAGASDASRWETLMLRRRAAEQFLVSGHLEPGIAALRPILDEIDLRYPSSPGGALVSALLSLVRLRLRGLGFEARDEGDVPFADLVRIDACYAAAKGLVLVDPARGAYFSLETLRRALETGEVSRLGRAFCVVGAALLPAGGGIARLAERMVQAARRLGDESGDPYLRAMVSLSTGQVRMVEGRWPEMLRLCDEGTRALTERCQGVTWERDIGAMASLRAAEELGRIGEVGERLARLRREADDLGDRYAQVTARLYTAFWHALQGSPNDARAEADAALAAWPSEDFQLQHLYALRVHAFCDVVDGRARVGFDRVQAAWPRVRRAGLLRHALLRTDAISLRARLAIAAAAVSERRARDRLLRKAQPDVKRLAAESRPDALATAALLRAGVEALRGDSTQASASLDRAIGTFAQAEMVLLAATARRRKGELLGDAGSRLREESDRQLDELGVALPARWLLLMAPGFDEARAQAKKAGRAEAEK